MYTDYNPTDGVVGNKSDYSGYNVNRQGSDCEKNANESDLNINDCYNRDIAAGAEFYTYRQQKTDEGLPLNNQQINNESFLRGNQTVSDNLFGGRQTNKRLEELKGRTASSPSPERRRIGSPLLVRLVTICSEWFLGNKKILCIGRVLSDVI